LLAFWSAGFFIYPQEVGTEPGYIFALFGVIPSIAFLILSFTRPKIAYTAVFLYGVFLIIGSIILTGFAYGFLWLVVVFPIYGFTIEGCLLYISYPILRRHNQV
jgi:hypothetical protein